MKYSFELTGVTPLLMHADDIDGADRLKAWRKNSANKDARVPGDDRSPAWSWQTYVYSDGEHLCCPADNIMKAIGIAGASMTVKGNKTFKRVVSSGLLVAPDHCELLNHGKQISIRSILDFQNDPFSSHVAKVRKLGFDLKVKRAKVGNAKHIRVRAQFDEWTIRGTVLVTNSLIGEDELKELFETAGRDVGLMDWRPSSPKSPGPYGQFKTKLKKIA